MRIRRPARRTALVCLALAAVVFALVVVLVIQREEASAVEQFDVQDAATAAASEAIPRMLGYEHATIAADLDDATEVMTKRFAKKYSELTPQLTATAQQRKIDVTATVRMIAALECGQECSTTSVRLLAFVDQNRTIATKPASPAALSIVVRMKQVDGDWLVDDLTTS
ncbi:MULTISPECIES: hypothetical protein [Aeromicrobium]|uniref:hypothetical protein n=1 Tax=Aeromicrobium TaxID=2040 RepID=UPI00257FEE35|nr:MULTISPECIES: hypothetical protein [Aeromicrobium]